MTPSATETPQSAILYIDEDLPGAVPQRFGKIFSEVHSIQCQFFLLMEKQGEGWSEPQPLPTSINTLSLHWTVSVADNYDLYFSAQEHGNTDIFLSRYIAEKYTDSIRVDAPVNTEEIELTPNIAPDGSYLLFTRIASNVDPPHLFITYALDSGWSQPTKVENVPYCISPIVAPDRSFVIYLSSPSPGETLPLSKSFIPENATQKVPGILRFLPI